MVCMSEDGDAAPVTSAGAPRRSGERDAHSRGVTETIDLRVIIGTLPLEERRVVVLHYLEGYQHEEVAQILGIPLRRIRQRLAAARGRLQQALAEGDLFYLNEPSWPMRH